MKSIFRQNQIKNPSKQPIHHQDTTISTHELLKFIFSTQNNHNIHGTLVDLRININSTNCYQKRFTQIFSIKKQENNNKTSHKKNFHKKFIQVNKSRKQNPGKKGPLIALRFFFFFLFQTVFSLVIKAIFLSKSVVHIDSAFYMPALWLMNHFSKKHYYRKHVQKGMLEKFGGENSVWEEDSNVLIAIESKKSNVFTVEMQ